MISCDDLMSTGSSRGLLVATPLGNDHHLSEYGNSYSYNIIHDLSPCRSVYLSANQFCKNWKMKNRVPTSILSVGEKGKLLRCLF